MAKSKLCKYIDAKTFATGELTAGLTALQSLPQKTMGSCFLLLFLLLSRLWLLQPKPSGCIVPLRATCPAELDRSSKVLAKEGLSARHKLEFEMCVGETFLPKSTTQGGMNL